MSSSLWSVINCTILVQSWWNGFVVLQSSASGPAERETWMLELPDKMKVGIGLQARTFKQRSTGDVDTSGWTDTPAQREKREKVQTHS